MKNIFIILLISTLLSGDDMLKGMKVCSKETDTIKRIECYDKLAKKDDVSANSEVKSDVGNWSVKEEQVKRNHIIVTFTNITKNIEGSDLEEIPLIIECNSKVRPYIYVNWFSKLGIRALVTSHFDDEESKELSWTLSTNGEASFYPKRSFNGMPIVEKYTKHDKFFASTIPYGNDRVSAVFDLSGLEELVKPYAEVCRIKPKTK